MGLSRILDSNRGKWIHVVQRFATERLFAQQAALPPVSMGIACKLDIFGTTPIFCARSFAYPVAILPLLVTVSELGCMEGGINILIRVGNREFCSHHRHKDLHIVSTGPFCSEDGEYTSGRGNTTIAIIASPSADGPRTLSSELRLSHRTAINFHAPMTPVAITATVFCNCDLGRMALPIAFIRLVHS